MWEVAENELIIALIKDLRAIRSRDELNGFLDHIQGIDRQGRRRLRRLLTNLSGLMAKTKPPSLILPPKR